MASLAPDPRRAAAQTAEAEQRTETAQQQRPRRGLGDDRAGVSEFAAKGAVLNAGVSLGVQGSLSHAEAAGAERAYCSSVSVAEMDFTRQSVPSAGSNASASAAPKLSTMLN